MSWYEKIERGDWSNTYKFSSIVRLAMDEAISPFNPLDDKFLISLANNIVKTYNIVIWKSDNN